MPAYARLTLDEFVRSDVTALLGALHSAYANDGFASQYTRQTIAWKEILPKLQSVFAELGQVFDQSKEWSVLLEYPLYRLRRRIDVVVLAGSLIVVIECKSEATRFTSADVRQVEEYALDLRDFHAGSNARRILPVLWSTESMSTRSTPSCRGLGPSDTTVAPVQQIGAEGLRDFLAALISDTSEQQLVAESWDRAVYRPVPTVIEAATAIFAGHDVRSIANADADNLRTAAARLVSLIVEARESRRRYLLVLTGVPGSGKTLAGLHVLHSALACCAEQAGDIVYLSGNTPLVTVLRESLARDEGRRRKDNGDKRSLDEVRRNVRTRIQHISDFLRESLQASPDAPPHEHVIIFDEAQRAWDEKQGKEKFGRVASEPALLLDIMSRHSDWCVCICLVGGGQEINAGEEGVAGWGEALRRMPSSEQSRWSLYASSDVVNGGVSAGSFSIGEVPEEVAAFIDDDLQLRVPQRSYRSPLLSDWVNLVIEGRCADAAAVTDSLEAYPIVLTRSLNSAKEWLRQMGRGERRFGMLASSGARRLRADGLGHLLDASAGAEIAHWYLNPNGDIRSSFALEVPANEYTCQGLELDFACVCWGGDLLWSKVTNSWASARLSGAKWQTIRAATARQYLANSYRVLLTRAREGMVIWVPLGDINDSTRAPKELDATAEYLMACGAVALPAN